MLMKLDNELEEVSSLSFYVVETMLAMINESVYYWMPNIYF